MTQILPFNNSHAVTMSSREIAESMSPDEVVLLVSISLAGSLRRLLGADDSTRRDCYEKMLGIDEAAMRCAHALRHNNSFFHYEAIQNIRMAVTLASIGYSPREILMSRKKELVKTYIAVNADSGLLKIGKSVNPDTRMNHLSTGAATKPNLLLVIDGDIEKKLHKRFSKLRVFGEWFRDDGSISAFIADQKQTQQPKVAA